MARQDWLSARGLAMFAGGASIGAVASRLLPPVVAQAAPWLTGDKEDPFETLMDDHRKFLDLLSRMEQSGGQGKLTRGQLLFRLKRSLAAHALAEEDAVYPLLAEQVGARSAAEHMYAEHGALKTHLYALERLLDDEAAWLARAGALRTMLAAHAREEEEVQFPRLRHGMTPDDIKTLGRTVSREKSMIL